MVSFITYIPHINVAICIIIIIIIFAVYSFISTYHIYNVGYHMLGGFWSADPSFCEDSGLDRFYIFIEPPGRGNMCWICMAKPNKSVSGDSCAIVNHMTTYNIKTQWMSFNNWTTDVNRSRLYMITFTELPENLTQDGLFPKTQILKLDISSGKLFLLDKNDTNSRVYFVGYKDSRISDLIDVDRINIESDNINDNDSEFEENNQESENI